MTAILRSGELPLPAAHTSAHTHSEVMNWLIGLLSLSSSSARMRTRTSRSSRDDHLQLKKNRLCSKPEGSPNLEPLIRCDKANPCGFVHDRALCCISVATCSVEFQLNEFICLTNVTESGEFPARWLVSVKVLRWLET